MSSQIETCIRFLKETIDDKSAYFSFTTDNTGEHGVIKANKEGLRLYAMELLKKSLEMENDPASRQVLFFEEFDWLVDDAGYNLIWGVDPTDATRDQIMAEEEIILQQQVIEEPAPRKPGPLHGWLPSLIILSGGVVIVTIAAFKWFH